MTQKTTIALPPHYFSVLARGFSAWAPPLLRG